MTPDTDIGGWFWVLFATSTVSHLGYSASIPIVPRFVEDEFGGGPAAVGLVVALTSIVALVVQPMAGVAADRFGYRRLTMAGSLIAAMGMAFTMVAFSVGAVGLGRVIFGIGESALLTSLIAWVVGVAKPGSQGRALSIFGVSVWLGFALGPVLSENVYQAAGFRWVWAVCTALPLASLLMVSFLPTPRIEDPTPPADEPRADDAAAGFDIGPDDPRLTPPAPLGGWRMVVSAVAVPGTVAAIVWAAQAMLMAYLVLHLESRGMRTNGATGAASVFTVFAGSVIAARLLVGSLPDRVGPVRSSQYSLVTLAVGLTIITVADNFAIAALGAVVLGVAFAPLYPAMVMLAVEGLDPSRRASVLGGFNAMTALGAAVGAFVGGVLSGWWGEWSAFAVMAATQGVGLVVVTTHGRRRAAALAH